MNINDYIIYCTYHDKRLIDEYNLAESENYKLYYTKENDDTSINHLQEFFCEFTAMFYVYSHKIHNKYKFIGLEHYKRKYVSFFINDYKGGIFGRFPYSGSLNYFLKTRFCAFLFDDIIDFVKANYSKDSRIYKIFVTKSDIDYTWLSNCIYMCPCKMFDEIVGFLYNFTMYVDNKYNLNSNYDNYKKFIEEKWFPLKHLGTIDFENESWLFEKPMNKYRIFAYLYEQILGCYFGYIKKFEYNK